MAKARISNLDLVSRLKFIENQFIQVLVTNFSLRRRSSGGTELLIRFSDESPAIST